MKKLVILFLTVTVLSFSCSDEKVAPQDLELESINVIEIDSIGNRKETLILIVFEPSEKRISTDLIDIFAKSFANNISIEIKFNNNIDIQSLDGSSFSWTSAAPGKPIEFVNYETEVTENVITLIPKESLESNSLFDLTINTSISDVNKSKLEDSACVIFKTES